MEAWPCMHSILIEFHSSPGPSALVPPLLRGHHGIWRPQLTSQMIWQVGFPDCWPQQSCRISNAGERRVNRGKVELAQHGGSRNWHCSWSLPCRSLRKLVQQRGLYTPCGQLDALIAQSGPLRPGMFRQLHRSTSAAQRQTPSLFTIQGVQPAACMYCTARVEALQ